MIHKLFLLTVLPVRSFACVYFISSGIDCFNSFLHFLFVSSTVQFSRITCCRFERQRMLSYYIHSSLSTLFQSFLKKFFEKLSRMRCCTPLNRAWYYFTFFRIFYNTWSEIVLKFRSDYYTNFSHLFTEFIRFMHIIPFLMWTTFVFL